LRPCRQTAYWKEEAIAKVRAAFLVTAFPTVSETFILDQITGLMDLGCEVEIFASQPEAQCAVHPEVDAYGLMSLRRLPQMPESYAQRPGRAIRLAAADWRDLGWPHARSLNFLRQGPRAASLRLFFETAAFAGRPAFDVIHCHFGPNGLRGLALRDIGALHGKLITSFYGYDVSEFPRQRRGNPYTQLFAKGDLFLAISEDMRGKLIGLGCEAARILVHPLGVKPEIFSAAHRAAAGSPVRITTIGRMAPKKGIEYGLQAVAALVRDELRVQYDIIGDGPLRPKIERMVEDLALGSVVRLAGWKARPDIVSALGETDILLAPSVTAESGDQEGTPVVIMEALASGVPVVSTLHAGIPEVVQDRVSGFLAPERDAGQLASALARLVRSPELRTCMGAQGRLDIAERHDIGKLNERLLGIYRGITAQTGLRPG
jgi:colanic acid/amylovoran biosynthesis glycosyltransferase